jgi:hypothetical protein
MRAHLLDTVIRSLLIHEGKIIPKNPTREVPHQAIDLLILLYKLNLSAHPAHNLHYEPA